MRQMEVDMNDSRSDTNMTITVGTGLGWGELYEEVSLRGQPAEETVLFLTLTDTYFPKPTKNYITRSNKNSKTAHAHSCPFLS